MTQNQADKLAVSPLPRWAELPDLALYMDHLFVAVLLPFLYCMGENLVTALLQIPQYSIMTSYVLNRLSPSCMNVWNYFVGVGTFTIFASGVIFVLKRRKQDVGSKG